MYTLWCSACHGHSDLDVFGKVFCKKLSSMIIRKFLIIWASLDTGFTTDKIRRSRSLSDADRGGPTIRVWRRLRPTTMHPPPPKYQNNIILKHEASNSCTGASKTTFFWGGGVKGVQAPLEGKSWISAWYSLCSSARLPALLASAACTADLQSKIIVVDRETPDVLMETAKGKRPILYNLLPSTGMIAHQQRIWDTPGIAHDKNFAATAASIPADKTRLFAVSAQHRSDWLHAHPISFCGLRLPRQWSRKSGCRLGLELCVLHTSPCGSTMDSFGLHEWPIYFGVKVKADPYVTQQINGFVYRSRRRPDVPTIKVPGGLTLSDGKRPNAITLIPSKGGRRFAWDATVIETLVPSYVSLSAISAGVTGAVAEMPQFARG